MNKQEMYQQALANAVEQAVNGKNAVKEYVTRLAQMKVEQILREKLGKDFACKGLDGQGRLIAVGYDVRDDFWDQDSYSYNSSSVITINLWFAKDVTEMIDADGVTDAERKVLRTIRNRYKEASKSTYFNYFYGKDIATSEMKETEKIKRADDDLRSLKNELKAITSGYYHFSFDDMMRDDFMSRSLSYNGQTIL